ncbi:putative aminomethyltransferase [Yarrowia sp. C11]|nr:putative aminomethyltransferase [Yarrowia sp. C11]KAG5364958.1 putative aminomethyltransferase [Yarrowia sp. E02]
MLRLAHVSRAAVSARAAIPTTRVALLQLARYSVDANLKKTPLFGLHEKLNAQFVDYAGFAMPVMYKGTSHIESHKWVREKAGLFDVSHMLQHRFTGPAATEFLEKITPADLQALQPYSSTLSVLLTNEGGIIDDLIISKHGDNDYYVVTNAGCRDKDLAFLAKEAKEFGDKLVHDTIGGGLIALQGPEAASALQKLTNYDLSQIKFGQSAWVDFGAGTKYHVARGGYTGEDGFEVSIPDDAASVAFSEALLENEDVIAVGLAARDSLRLEAGMCLYGHELSEELTPVEAGLTWVVGKARRSGDRAAFNGSDKILAQIKDKSATKARVGLFNDGPAPREGVAILNEAGEKVGEVTSGCKSPSLNKNIGMGYVNKPFNKSGTKLTLDIRNKKRPAEVVKMPFVAHKYFK